MAAAARTPSLVFDATRRSFPAQWRSAVGRTPVHCCSVAHQHQQQQRSAISTVLSIREAKLEDVWQIADTHCSVFMPQQGLLMDLALRFDRVMALLGSLSTSSSRSQKKCLVAVEEASAVAAVELVDMMGLVFPSFTPGYSSVAGVLTIDNIGEFLPRRKPSGRRRSGIAYVSNLAVRKSRRRMGIARKLLRASELLAKSWGCRSMALHCASDNGAAIALYLAEGYRVVKLAMVANWPRPKGPPGSSSYLLLMKSLYSLRLGS